LKDLEAGTATTHPYHIAEVHAYRRETDQPFARLDRAWLLRDLDALNVKRTPLLSNIRGNPRYKAFPRKMKLPE
jgi:hypothetical protein